MLWQSFRLIITLFFFIQLLACTQKKVAFSSEPKTATDWAETCEDWDLWDKDGPAFRIYGNSYYVGTCGIAAILIVGDQGHILIDSGTAAGADVVAKNIQALGFSLKDIKILLHSHEHHDHVGGMAKLQQLTGAQLLTSAPAAPVLNTGKVAANDPQADSAEDFAAASVSKIISNGHKIKLGTLSLTALSTPGHTHGALSWQWQSCEGDHCLSMVYADSLSPVSSEGYLFSKHPEYVESYKKSLSDLSKLTCDIILAPHPSAAQLRQRILNSGQLVNSNGCKNYADAVLNRLNKRLKKESSQKS